MLAFSTDMHVRAPQSTVWAFLADLHRNAEWEANVQTVLSISEGPVGLGTVFRERLRVLGPFHAESEWRITEFKAPHVHEHRGMLPVIGETAVRYTLEEATGGSLCTVEVSCTPIAWPFGGLLQRLFVGPALARSMRRSMRRLKALLEAQSMPAGPGEKLP